MLRKTRLFTPGPTPLLPAAQMAMASADDGSYPMTNDIAALGAFLKQQSYWEEPILHDPWGQPYRCESGGAQYRVWSVGADAMDGSGDDISTGHAVEPRHSAKEQRAP